MDISYLADYSKILKPHELIHILVFMETWPEEKGTERKPLNLALVLDRSGSMEGPKLKAIKEASEKLVQKLQSKDLISVIAYDSEIEVLVPPTSGGEKERILKKIQSIETKGCTNLSGGWIRGLSLVLEKATPEYLNRVLLLTDGLANEGLIHLENLLEIGKQFREKQVFTTTLGFGQDFNEKHLLSIAQASGGKFYYISGPEEATNVFLSEFGDLVKVVGQNLKITFSSKTTLSLPPPRLCGTLSKSTQGNSVSVEMGDLLEEDRKQLLFSLSLPSSIPPGKHEVGEIQITYDSVKGVIGPRAHVLQVDLEVLDSGEPPQANPVVEKEILLYKVGDSKIAAARMEKEGDIAEASRLLERAAEELLLQKHLDEEGFQWEIEELRNLAQQLISQKIDRSSFSKTMYSTAYSQSFQMGPFKKKPKILVKNYNLTPSSSEKIFDLTGKIRSLLASFDFDIDFISKSEFILRELVDNALKHGCKDRPNAVVDVEIRISKHYFKCIVDDHGPGFDYKEILKQERKAAHPRHKGFYALEKLGALLQFNGSGNTASATLGSQSFQMRKESHPLLKDGFVGEILVVTVLGSLDNMTHYRLQEEVSGIFADGGNFIVIDLATVPYISSSGIGTLIHILDQIKQRQGRLILSGIRQNVYNIIDLLGLKDFFEITASTEEALKKLNSL